MLKVSKMVNRLAMKKIKRINKKWFSIDLKGKEEDDKGNVVCEVRDPSLYNNKHHQEFCGYVESFIKKNHDKLYGGEGQVDRELADMFKLIHLLARTINSKFKKKQKNFFFKFMDNITSKLEANNGKDKAINNFYEKTIQNKLKDIIKGCDEEYKFNKIMAKIDFKDKLFSVLLKYFVLLRFDTHDANEICRNRDYEQYFKLSSDKGVNDYLYTDDVQQENFELFNSDKEDEKELTEQMDFDDLFSNNKSEEVERNTANKINSTLKENLSMSGNLNHVNIENYQDFFEITIIRKTPEIQRSNWVYMMDLPYEVDEKKFEKSVSESLKGIGKIKNIVIQQYQDSYIEKQENLQFETDPKENFTNFISQNYDSFSKQGMERSVLFEDSIRLDQNILKTLKEDKKPSKKQKTKAELNKSCALIEFESYEQKEKLLDPQLRVFGLYVDESCVRVEDADNKYLINVSNIPFGFKTQNLVDIFNKEFEKHNIPKFSLTWSYSNKIIINGSIAFGFEEFNQALKACEILKGLSINDHTIKTSFFYGNLRYNNGEYIEDILFKSFVLSETKQKKTTEAEISSINKKKREEKEESSEEDFLANFVFDFSNDLLAEKKHEFELNDTVETNNNVQVMVNGN